MDITKVAIKGSTQEHLEIADIRNDLVLLKDGSVALVIRVSAVNFGLLSEKEQEAIIFAYAGLLNSLNFPIQIVVRSQKKDVSHYVALLGLEEKRQKNHLLADQIRKYRDFVVKTVKENNVLDKKFYIVIPFSSLELGVVSAAGGILKSKKQALPLPADTIIEKARVALIPKRDHILRQLGRLALRARQMSTAELVDLFYEEYNSSAVASQGEINSSAVASQGEINSSVDRPQTGSTAPEGPVIAEIKQDQGGASPQTIPTINTSNNGHFEAIAA